MWMWETVGDPIFRHLDGEKHPRQRFFDSDSASYNPTGAARINFVFLYSFVVQIRFVVSPIFFAI